MPLNRNIVERIAAEHIRRLQQHGQVSAEQKRHIREMHERIARKVDTQRNR